MIVRFSLILGIFLLSCSCGTSQGPNQIGYIPFTYQPLKLEDKDRLMAVVKAKYESLLGNKGFSGQILVAKNGQILFEDYKGFSLSLIHI